MAYVINRSDGTAFTTLQDATINTDSSLTLVGRNYIGYGELQNENFLFLLENFANTTAPSRPISGQLWFDTTGDVLKAYDGTKWTEVGSAILSATPPTNPPAGAFWLKTGVNTLHTWDGTNWIFIGPESADGFGVTRARSTTLRSDTNVDYAVILLTVNDIVVGIISSNSFTINSANAVAGFSDLDSGITLHSSYTVKAELNGNSATTTKLKNTRLINGIGFDGTRNITLKAATNFKLRAGDYIVSTAQAQQAIETLTITGAGLAAVNTQLFYRGLTISGNRIWADNLLNDPQLDSTVYLVEQTSAYILVDRTSGDSYLSDGKPANPWEITSWNTSVLSAPAPYPTITVSQTVSSSSKDFDGSNEVSFNVYAKTSNIAGSVVARNASGGFAAGLITADLAGNVTGNVTASSGTSRFDVVEANTFIGATLTGNAFSATKLRTARNINGVPFDGQSNITVPASARTLTDTALASNIVSSQLESVGLLNKLDVNGLVTISSSFTIAADSNDTTLTANRTLKLRATDGSGSSIIDLISPDVSVAAGYGAKGAITPSIDADLDLGKSAKKWDNVYANTFVGDLQGNADTATLATTATNIAGGAAGSIAYQTASGTTALLPAGSPDQVLASRGTAAPPVWVDNVYESAQAVKLKTSRTINGVGFDGTANITITDNTRVALAGDTMTGFLTLHANPTANMHATPKQYVDSEIAAAIATIPTPYWAGATTLANVQATYAAFPTGTRVSFWNERVYNAPRYGNGGAATVYDRYKETVEKQANGTWITVG